MTVGVWVRIRLERVLDAVIDHATPVVVTASAGAGAMVSAEVAAVGVLAGGFALGLASGSIWRLRPVRSS